MATGTIQIRVPQTPAADTLLRELPLRGQSDCSAITRSAKLLSSLVDFSKSERRAFARAISSLCKSFANSGVTANVKFHLTTRNTERFLDFHVVPTSDVGKIHEWIQRLEPNGISIPRRYEEYTIVQLPDKSSDNRALIGWRLPSDFRMRLDSELEQWRIVLNADSLEEAVVSSIRQNTQLSARLHSHVPEAMHTDDQNLSILSLVVRKAANAIVIMNSDGIVEWINGAFTKMADYSSSDAIGKRLDELLFGPSTAENAVRDFHDALRNGYELTQDVLQYRRDGRTFWAECNLIPVHDEGGHVAHWIAMNMDISKRRQTEESLLAAKRSAESTSRAKSEFLANMSHEIRTPLNAIIGMTELALGTKLSSEQLEYVKAVHASANTLLELLNDILDLSKIEAGKLTIEEVEFELSDVVHETLRALAVQAHEKGLELAVQMPMNLPTIVKGDVTRLRQVLFNLVGNAIKFTNEGEVLVTVEQQWCSDAEFGLHVSIKDTGIGIPREKLQSIFESFTQVDSSIARQFGGTGLGLTITAQLLAMMNGRIWVQSQEAAGSTFHLTLPLKITGKDDPGVSNAGKDLTGKSVLVLEDNASQRRILDEMLRHWKMRTTITDSASSAFQIIEDAACSEQPFDVILLNGMPTSDGCELANILKGRPDLKSQSIVMLSTIDQSNAATKCQELGVDRYLVKPFSADTLFDAITALQDGNGTGDPPKQRENLREEVPDVETTPLRSLQILVVDDHEYNRSLATKILQKRGHRCTEATDGAQALEAIKRTSYDVVLLDVQMPKMDGIQTTREIRRLENGTTSHLWIVALTAHAMAGDREKCLAAGMDDYLPKPINARQLISVVERISREPLNGNESQSHGKQTGHFDFSRALDRMDGEQDLLLESMNYFLKDAPSLVEQVTSAIHENDAHAVEKTAHRLRGLLSCYDQPTAVRLAQELEVKGRESELNDSLPLIRELTPHVDKLADAIRTYRQQARINGRDSLSPGRSS